MPVSLEFFLIRLERTAGGTHVTLPAGLSILFGNSDVAPAAAVINRVIVREVNTAAVVPKKSRMRFYARFISVSRCLRNAHFIIEAKLAVKDSINLTNRV